MDKTIIFTLVLSACFLGSILWLAIHSRRQQRAAAREQQPPPAQTGRQVRRPRAGRGDKTD